MKKTISKEQLQAQIQEKSYEFEMLRRELTGIEQEMSQLSERVGSFERVKIALNALKNTKKGEELIIPLGEGLFIKANMGKIDDVLLGVGSNIVIGKSILNAINYVNERIDEANKLIKRLTSNANNYSMRLRHLEPELQNLVSLSKGN